MRRDVLVVGLTGGIASGKTTVSKMLAELGLFVIDADAIAHRLIEPEGRAFRKVIERFGDSIIEKGRIDRRKLADIVFKDRKALDDLNAIVHPLVREEIAHLIEDYAAGISFSEETPAPQQTKTSSPEEKSARGKLIQERSSGEAASKEPADAREEVPDRKPSTEEKREETRRIVIIEAALLVETGSYRNYDRLIVVHCSRETQVRRIMERDKLSREEALERIASQMPMEEKINYADHLINSDRSFNEVERQTRELCHKLLSSLDIS